ncbi:MAG: DUF927 domain-containing protein [Burkholderiales bacterium]|nr:DUF927 domain-containing protein [Burkholderiales bacterium]
MTKRAAAPSLQPATPELIRSALFAIPPDLERSEWVRVGMAVKSELGSDGFSLWDEWSSQSGTYRKIDARDAWKSFKPGGRVTVGTLFGMAKDHGFRFPEASNAHASVPTPEAMEAQRRLAEERERKRAAEEAEYRRRADKAEVDARELWDTAHAVGHSPYLARKGVGAHGVRFMPDGTLLVPMLDEAGVLRNVQRIAPTKPTAEEQDRGVVEKRFMPGGRKSGLFHLLGGGDGAAEQVVLLAEGYATAATLHEAAAFPVAVAFDAGNLPHVAKALRRLFPAALLLVCGDDDRQTEARTGRNPGREKAAAAARAAAVDAAPAAAVFPSGLPEGGTDFNDLAAHAGLAVVRTQVMAAVQAPSLPGRRRASRAAQAPIAAADGDGAAIECAEGGAVAEDTGGEPAAAEIGKGGGEDEGQKAAQDPFTLADGGVYFTARDADGNRKRPEWLCAPLRVVAHTRGEDSNGWGYLLEFEDLDRNAKAWAMPAAVLGGDGAEWLGRLLDMGLQVSPKATTRRLLAQYIATRRPHARAFSTDRVGWHEGGVYVLPSGCVGEASEGRRYVFQSEGGVEDNFRQRGTLGDWQRSLGRLCEGNTRLAFAVCCAFAGPLLRLAGMESGGFHFRDESSKGKTTTLLAAASVWGAPSYMQRWRTTDNALESTAVQHCDGLLILDEIGQADGKMVGESAYMLANEQEKGRATRGGLARKRRTWRLLFLSSGEKSLASHMAESGKRVMAGQEVRLVDIPLDAGAGMGGLEVLHDHDGPGALAEAIKAAGARHYGTAGRAWLDWLAKGFSELPGRIGRLMEAQRQAIVPESASEQVRRVGARFALVAVAGELAVEAGVAPWPPGEAASAARTCFNAWLGSRGHLDNGETVAMLRQVRAYLETNGDALFTWWHRAMDDHRGNTPLRSGFRRRVDESGEPLPMDSASEYLERTGGDRSTRDALVEFLVLPEAFRREVAKGFDSQAVAELLRKRGHLKHEAGRLTMRQRLPGMGKAPVYHIKPSIFDDELL